MPGTSKVKSVIISVCLGFIFFFADAQSAKEHLQKADRFYLKKDYQNALLAYEEVLAMDPNDAVASFKAGISCIHSQNFSQAVAHLEKAYQLKPDVDPDIDYHLGVAYQENHQYALGRRHFETLRGKNKKFASIVNQKIMECAVGDSLMALPSIAVVEALAAPINTPFSEFSPLVSSDGGMFIFTSNRSSDEYQVKSRTNMEDVYISHRNGSEWGEPRKIGESINVRLNEAATSLSADGKTLFLYYEDGGGDIYTSTLENGHWSTPAALNRFINHPQYRESSAYVSPDGKRLFFSSNRPGGKGGFDIYVCDMGANGQWGRPSNLGSVVNTRRDEESPFISADGKTLYFSSNGHATLGDRDIFKTILGDGKWSAPVNLGYPINTSGYEGFFVLSDDNTTGYFTSRRWGNAGNTDIYSASFSSPAAVVRHYSGSALAQTETDEVNSKIVTLLKGSVTDVADASPLQTTISLVDNTSKKIISKISTDQSGNFQIVIPYPGNFGVTTERKGYLFNSMNFTFPSFEKYREIETNILMVKATVGSKVVLKNIFFDINQSQLKPESLSELENIHSLLRQNPQWRIQINGHTDNIGHREANRTLSLKRAQAVVDYLIGQGISPTRLQAKGFGADRPLVSNDDEKEGRQINRRTEIEIVE